MVYDKTIAALLTELSSLLKEHAEQPRQVARLLLADELGCNADTLIANHSVIRVDESFLQSLKQKVARFAAGEPIAYILGQAEFYGNDFLVGPGVLIPRPDTEILVEAAVRSLRRQSSVKALELCTGSACIAISFILNAREQGVRAQVVATEISSEAIDFAIKNRQRFALDEQLDIRQTDLFPEGEKGFDLLLANPPYIDQSDMEKLDPGVRCYEPEQALAGGADGLDFYRRIYEEAPRYLRPGAVLICEHGYRQAESIHAIISEYACYTDLILYKDYAGRPRVTLCCYEPANPWSEEWKQNE